MAAAKSNYIICYRQSAQVYSSASLETALKTPLPKGCKPEDKKIMFMSFLPDSGELCVYELTEEQLQSQVNTDEQA